MMFFNKVFPLGFAVSCVLAAAALDAWGGQVSADIAKPEQELLAGNVLKETAPTIILTGKTVVTNGVARHCTAPTLNGIKLAEELLTNERLTIQFGSGAADFVYDPGFNSVGAEVPVNSVYFNKYKYDMFAPKGGGNVFDSAGFRLLWTSTGGKPVHTVYRFAFPEGMLVKKIMLSSSHRLASQSDVVVLVSKDPDGKEILGKGVAFGDRLFPVTVEGFASNVIYLHITSERSKGQGYGESMLIHGWLDTGAMPKLTLKPGENKLVYTDAADSSHAAELKVVWSDEPVIADFENDDGVSKWHNVKRSAGYPIGANSGAACGQVDWEWHGDGGKCNASFDKFPERDWTKYKSLSLAINCPDAPPGQIVMGFYDQGGKELKPRFNVASFRAKIPPSWKTDGWCVMEMDISQMQRGNVAYLQIYTGISWSEGKKYTFYIDDLRLSESPVVWPQARDASTLAALRKNILPSKPIAIPEQPGRKTIPPIREFFPIGAWGLGDVDVIAREMGVDEWQVYEGVMDDFVRHNQNMIAWKSPGDLLKLCRLAEVKGLRLYPHGPVFYHSRPDPAEKKRFWEGLQKNVEDIAPKFRGYWGLLCWEITEEIPPNVVPELSAYYQLLNRLDPDHPGVIIHNNTASSEADAKLNRPSVICHDIYPIFNAPEQRSRNYYKSMLKSLWKNADSCGAVAWVLPQSYSEGYMLEGEAVLSRRHPTAVEMKWQAWSAVAQGCTGLFLYGWDYPTPKAYAEGICFSLKTPTGEDTPQWKAWGEVSGVMLKLAPTLLKLHHVDKTYAKVSDGGGLVDAQSFDRRDGKGRFVIVVNDDFHNPQTFALALEGADCVQDVLTGKTLKGEQLKTMTLPPGEGLLLEIK
jgi:hypothetical protein